MGSENFSQWTKKRGLSSLLTTGDPKKTKRAQCPFGNDGGIGVNLDDDDGDVGVGGGVLPCVLIYADCRAPDGEAVNAPGNSGR